MTGTNLDTLLIFEVSTILKRISTFTGVDNFRLGCLSPDNFMDFRQLFADYGDAHGGGVVPLFVFSQLGQARHPAARVLGEATPESSRGQITSESPTDAISWWHLCGS